MEVISRKAAEARGLTHYYTRRPCANGHMAPRAVRNKSCVDCGAIYRARQVLKAKQIAVTQQAMSRSDAMMRGLTRYYTGKPCPSGHYAARFVTNGVCVDCGSDRNTLRRCDAQHDAPLPPAPVPYGVRTLPHLPSLAGHFSAERWA